MALHVVSRRKLQAFWDRHPAAEEPLRRWHALMETEWSSFADIRATFRSADLYQRVVTFNVGGNKYRLIAAVHYNRRKVYIRQVLTHAE